jgi:translation elongation factor EF-Ts
MEISLEKIDLVRDRTGASYKAAKEALEATEGSVIDAIIYIEEKQNTKWTDNISGVGNDLLEKMKQIIKKGNVTKVLLKKDGEIIMNIPVTAGAIGAILSPPVAMAGILTALVTKCKIEIVKMDGEIVDVNEMAEDTMKNVKSRVNEFKDKMQTRSEDEENNEE